MQISLAERGMQTRLLRICTEGFLIFPGSFVPTAAFEQQIAEEAVSPGRLAIQVRATISQAGREIQVLVTQLEPSFALIRVEGCEQAEFVRRSSEVFLT